MLALVQPATTTPQGQGSKDDDMSLEIKQQNICLHQLYVPRKQLETSLQDGGVGIMHYVND